MVGCLWVCLSLLYVIRGVTSWIYTLIENGYDCPCKPIMDILFSLSSVVSITFHSRVPWSKVACALFRCVRSLSIFFSVALSTFPRPTASTSKGFLEVLSAPFLSFTGKGVFGKTEVTQVLSTLSWLYFSPFLLSFLSLLPLYHVPLLELSLIFSHPQSVSPLLSLPSLHTKLLQWSPSI